MRPVTTAAATLVLAVLTGCGTSGPGPASTAGPATAAPATAAPSATSTGATASPTVQAFLSSHGLAGLDAAQIVEKLDASDEDRTAGPMGSVRPTELVLSDPKSGEKVSLPMPADRFYLAMAPYTSETHECFNHSTSGCQGELVGETVHVTLTAGGRTVVDQDVTTAKNGFAAVWVPRGLTGTLRITRGSQSVEVPVSTKDDAATCLTTPLRLA